MTVIWKSSDANQPQYNCGRKYPDSGEAKKFFELFNALSLDPITKEEIEKELLHGNGKQLEYI